MASMTPARMAFLGAVFNIFPVLRNENISIAVRAWRDAAGIDARQRCNQSFNHFRARTFFIAEIPGLRYARRGMTAADN
jgi:hypothetical protein